MDDRVQTGVRIAVAVLVILLGLWLAYALRTLLVLVLIAVVLSIGIDPVVERMHLIAVRGRHLPRAMAAVLILVAALLALLGIITFFVVTAVREVTDPEHGWTVVVPRIQEWLNALAQRYPAVIPSPEVILRRVGGQSEQIAGYLWSTTQKVFGVLGGLFSLLTVVILTLFLTIFKDGILYTLLQFIPPRHHEAVRRIGGQAAAKMGGWLRGQIILAIIITGVTALAMSLFRVPYAMLIGIIGGIGEMIPMVGPYVAFVPALLIVLAIGAAPWQILLVFLFFTVLSQVENYVLAPKVMERHVELSPVSTILCLLAGGTLAGLVGALLAVPIAAGLRVVLLEAVFPAIQGKSRLEIEAARPGAHMHLEEPDPPASAGAPPAPETPPAPADAPRKSRRRRNNPPA